MFRKIQLSQKKPRRKRIRRWTPMIIVAQPPEKKRANRKETVSKNSLPVRRKKAVATNSVNRRTVPENKDIKSPKKPESTSKPRTKKIQEETKKSTK
ncbi:unnamed protein product [Brassica oleracea var. botrytis]|uniref:Uncharacterized protein n=2 Tax=Brassica TaxID=3705 RepID=A0A3P6EYL0_BRAOL|nr:unnamed protein product [Brassica napus]VDD37192.1 unnamed protein product [Brassica oleracea]